MFVKVSKRDLKITRRNYQRVEGVHYPNGFPKTLTAITALRLKHPKAVKFIAPDCHYDFDLVESYRIEGGSPRHRQVATIGSINHSKIDANNTEGFWRRVVANLREHKVNGKTAVRAIANIKKVVPCDHQLVDDFLRECGRVVG